LQQLQSRADPLGAVSVTRGCIQAQGSMRDKIMNGSKNLAFRYRLDRCIRAAAMFIMNRIMPRTASATVDLRRERIDRILLVRGVFRLGNAILAIPSILLFRRNFPDARIDFIGGSAAKSLFINLPIDHFYGIYHNYLKASWSYLILLAKVRAQKYDLAVDVSGSSTAMGAFIVGASGARWRAGLAGKWDRWFNLRFARSVSSRPSSDEGSRGNFMMGGGICRRIVHWRAGSRRVAQ